MHSQWRSWTWLEVNTSGTCRWSRTGAHPVPRPRASPSFQDWRRRPCCWAALENWSDVRREHSFCTCTHKWRVCGQHSVNVLHPARHKRGHFGDVLSQTIFWPSTEDIKLKTTKSDNIRTKQEKSYTKLNLNLNQQSTARNAYVCAYYCAQLQYTVHNVLPERFRLLRLNIDQCRQSAACRPWLINCHKSNQIVADFWRRFLAAAVNRTRTAITRGRIDHLSNIFFQWLWTLTCDADLRKWRRQSQSESARHISRLKVI